jgi:DnaJ like chaperone protein
VQYRTNIGCLWLILLLLVIGGSPLVVGLLRIAGAFVLVLFISSLALGWWLRRHAVVRYARTQTEAHNRFVELLVALLVHLAEVDGPINSGEVAAIRRFFQDTLGYRGERLLWVRDLIKASRKNPTPVERICAQLRDGFGLQERFIAMQVLARVAEADGRVAGPEIEFLERVAADLGLHPFFSGATRGSRWTGDARGARPGGQSEIDHALAVLGLSGNASSGEIKTAWRKLSMEHHPDRVAHLGSEFTALAEERMRKINRAYSALKESGRVD